MAISREQFNEAIEQITAQAGDNDVTLQAISLLNTEIPTLIERPDIPLEDVQDENGVKWKDRHAELQARYRSAFLNGINNPNEGGNNDNEIPPEKITFNDLFK